MKKSLHLKPLLLVFIASIALLTGCGEDSSPSTPTSSNTGAVEEQSQLDKQKQFEKDAKGISMEIVDAVYYPEDGAQAPIVFEINMQNKGELTVDVNNLKFYLVTVNNELIETALSSRNSSSRYIMPEGTTTFKAAFEVDDPGSLGGMMFADQNLDIAVRLPASEFPTLRMFGETVQSDPPPVEEVEIVESQAPIEEKQEKATSTDNPAQTAADAIKIVEALDPGNFTASHDFPEYDITTVDGAHYYYINYTSAEGMGGDVFVRKGTSEVFGYTIGTEDDPDAPFPDFSNQIQ